MRILFDFSTGIINVKTNQDTTNNNIISYMLQLRQ
jgi:hypothetical protein